MTDLTNMKKAQRHGTVCIRGVDLDVWDEVRRRAQAEGIFIREWIERAFLHELGLG
jgi:hypothetical protein